MTSIDLRSPRAQNSPSLSVDPRDPRVVAAASRVDGPEFGCALHVSGSGGRGWVPVRPVTRLPAGVDRCYAPEIAFDSKGILYFLFIGLRGAGNVPVGAFLTTSSDHGRSFRRPWRVLGPDRFMVRMAVDAGRGPHRGRVHLAWLRAASPPALGGFVPGDNPVQASHSDDGGRTFSRPVRVSPPGDARVVAPALAMGREGAVHVAFYDLGDDAVDYQGLEGPAWEGAWSLLVSTSADGGARFSRPVVVDGAIVPASRVMLIFTMPAPALAADGDGRVYVAWSDAREGDADVFLRRSSDGGSSWAAARRVNDDAIGNGRDQYLPRLSVAPGGRLDVVFYDRRGDAENLRNEVMSTSSADGGRHLAPNRALTSVASDSRTGARYPVPSAAGLVEFGSRLGSVSLPGSVLAAWTDTRMAHPGSLQQDVYARMVTR